MKLPPLSYDILGDKSYVTPTNPRGWNPNLWGTGPGNLNVALIQRAAQNITLMKTYGSTGIIFWDADGGYGQAVAGAYYGVLTELNQMEPEMVAPLHAMCGMYHQANLDVGFLLRAEDWTIVNGVITAGVFSTNLFDTFAPQVEYAINNYGASMFYLDSVPEGGPGNSVVNQYQQLAQAFPNVLFIPERLEDAGFKWASSFGNGAVGYAGTPSSARALTPSATSYVWPSMTIANQSPAAINSRGDHCLLPAWYNSPEVAAQIILGNP
jgi:hypothetical protein